MSTISVPYISSHKEYAKTREKVQKMVSTSSSYSSRHDLGVILGVSGLLLAAGLIVTIIVPIAASYSGSSGNLERDRTSECRATIIGFQQSGFYSGQDQFKSALSYC